MKNTLFSILTALSVTSCTQYPSEQVQWVNYAMGIACENILSDTVTDNQIHNFVLNQNWLPWQRITTLYGMEAIIRDIDTKEPISRDGLTTLERQYIELNTLEKEWKKLSEQEQIAVQNQHLIELFQVFLNIKHE
jgi:hypothetical protein